MIIEMSLSLQYKEWLFDIMSNSRKYFTPNKHFFPNCIHDIIVRLQFVESQYVTSLLKYTILAAENSYIKQLIYRLV